MQDETAGLTLPLFPLNTVLFPGIRLPLHIFEERYRAMVRDLDQSANRFCVALIREGREVGGPALPYSVGCLAEVTDLRPLRDGRYFLLAAGVERVRILSTDSHRKPYLVGTVSFLPDGDPTAGVARVDEVLRLFRDYQHYMARLAQADGEPTPLPADPAQLSFLVASAMQLDEHQRQRLLEAPDVGDRLRAEIELLKGELPIIRALVKSPRPPETGSKFSAN